MGATRLAQRERRAHDGAHRPGCGHGRDLAHDRRNAGTLGVVEVHEQKGRVAGDGGPDRQGDLGGRALSGADDASALGDQLQVGRKVHADDEFVHEIDAAPVRELVDAGDDVLGLVVDGLVGAE